MISKDQSPSLSLNQSSIISSTFCKNHPHEPSGFFIIEQPWIKYCKTCALNAALCGRKIQKELSCQQFERKMQISLVVHQLKKTLQIQQQNNHLFQKAIAMLEQASTPLFERLHEIDQTLKQLQQSKQKLQKLYEKQIAQKVSGLVERRMRISLHSRQLKTELQTIQSNFGTIIQSEDGSLFSDKVEKWSFLLQKSKKELINEHEYAQTKEQILKVAEIFYDQIEKLSKVSFKFPFVFKQFKLTSPEDTFDMVLTPVDSNSLNTSISLEQQLAKKPKTQLKLRSKRKSTNQTTLCNQTLNLRRKPELYVQPKHLINSTRAFYK